MSTNIDINQLLQKPVAMMTGEELLFLFSAQAISYDGNPDGKGISVQKGHRQSV